MSEEVRCSFCGRNKEEINKIDKNAELIKGVEVKGVVSCICFLCAKKLKEGS